MGGGPSPWLQISPTRRLGTGSCAVRRAWRCSSGSTRRCGSSGSGRRTSSTDGISTSPSAGQQWRQLSMDRARLTCTTSASTLARRPHRCRRAISAGGWLRPLPPLPPRARPPPHPPPRRSASRNSRSATLVSHPRALIEHHLHPDPPPPRSTSTNPPRSTSTPIHLSSDPPIL